MYTSLLVMKQSLVEDHLGHPTVYFPGTFSGLVQKNGRKEDSLGCMPS